MSSIRALYSSAAELLKSWASNEVVRPLLEPILHPSRWRIRALGLSTAFGHPLFYWIWAKLLPQPYENLWLRLMMSALGVSLLVFPSITASPPSKFAAAIFTAIFWITLPWFFSWMYFCNNGNTVWLASLAAMFLIYYHLTDWRIATLGTTTGVLAAWLLFQAAGPETPGLSGEQIATNGVVIAFAWFMGVVLGISSSNLRREQLNYTLGTMGIMAHELRTPLATMSLIGDAVRGEASRCEPEPRQTLEKLAGRLHALVRNMNHQIDTQIANARLMRLPTHKETVNAADLVREAVNTYPYRSSRERESVQLQVHGNFLFEGSHALFLQVVDNLLKNALRSLAAATAASQPGDLTIEVGTAGNRGRIVVTDRGVGMEADLQARIFEPFFSTDRGSGHGLGLAFCQRVIHGARGSIRVRSELTHGAAFIVELPILG
ncbi:MAG TPA: HAMP domain-containing sensor histidine kinase [Ramlibacter sp.]|nr:HAMP domain-containing sensor histidine kinase [Ramlibacter sp.]